MLNSTNNRITVRAPKRLDALTSPYLAQDLEAKIQRGSQLVLDLSHTQMIEPASVEVILQGLALARQREAKFSLRGVNPQVQLTLNIAGILQYFRKTLT